MQHKNKSSYINIIGMQHQNKKYINIFFKSGQIYMKDPESTETKEKSNIRFFQFLFFQLWSFLF